MPSILHRQAEDARYGRTCRQVPPQVRDTHPIGAWALAQLPEKTPYPGGFFCFTALSGTPGPGTAAGTACDGADPDSRVAIASVTDGDTVVTAQGERIRLIGVDAPELDPRGGSPEPGAVAARDYLREVLGPGSGAALVWDIERRDDYGRLLAHLFLEDGTNVQALLLRRGLATPFTFPPNLKFSDCYHAIADAAIARDTGIWALPRYAPRRAAALQSRDHGYHVVSGRSGPMTESKYSLRFLLDSRLAITILKEDLVNFRGVDINSLAGKRIRVQGVIYTRDRMRHMRIRHPVDIKQLE